MNLALWKKNVSDSRLVFLACAAVLFGFCWIRVWIVSQLEMERVAAVVKSLWENWGERFVTIPIDFILTYTGRIALGYVDPVVTFSMAIWAITRGSDAVSGELGRGTMEMLLAQPVSRLQVLLTQAGFTIAGIALLAAAAWCGTYTGVMLHSVVESKQPEVQLPVLPWSVEVPFVKPNKVEVPLRDEVDVVDFLPATFNLFAYGVCLAGIATFLSSWDMYRWRTIGLAAGVLIVSIVLKLVGMAVKSVAWLKYASFLVAYEPERFTMIAYKDGGAWSFFLTSGDQITALGPLGYSAILLGLGAAGYAAAAAIFCHRDLPAPL